METGSDRTVSPQSGEQQQHQPIQADVATADESSQFLNNLRQVAMHPSPDPFDTVTSGLFFWSARQ